jgi:hypothetical protein
MNRRSLLIMGLLVLMLVCLSLAKTAFLFLRFFAMAGGALGLVTVILVICVLKLMGDEDKK